MEQETRSPANQPPSGEKAQGCTAPNPALSFVFFLATLAVVLAAAYLVWKFR
jgi:hypothetical protein